MYPEFDAVVPHPEGVDPSALIHERAYIVRGYRLDAETLLLRGAIRDQKPPGLYIKGDPLPLTMHHMIVDMRIHMPTLEIVDAKAVLETHPHTTCPRIADHYGNLVGLSVARGYTHKVRELFGGPRGCTHTTALLQAMAPVAVQSTWSFRMAGRRDGSATPDDVDESRRRSTLMNLNTCHVWAEDGEIVTALRSGAAPEYPISVRKRLAELGREVDTWLENG